MSDRKAFIGNKGVPYLVRERKTEGFGGGMKMKHPCVERFGRALSPASMANRKSIGPLRLYPSDFLLMDGGAVSFPNKC